MGELLNVWRAGRVRRWHTNPHLSKTDDFIDGHSARVATLALTLSPSLSRDAIVYGLTHDHGEFAVGDMSYMVKSRYPELADSLDAMENEARAGLGFGALPDGDEMKVVKLADWLDAWLWMAHHEPQLCARSDWLSQLSDAMRLAAELGVSALVRRMIDDMGHDASA